MNRRVALLISAGVITVALSVARTALRNPGGGRDPGVGRCEVTWSLSLGTEVAEVPHDLIAARGTLWAALVNPTNGVGERAARVRVLRVLEGRRYAEVQTATAGRAEAVSGFVSDAAGVHLAVAAGRGVRLLSPEATGAARERAFPQGPADAARDAVTPALALALDPEGTPTVLAHWAGRFAPRRWRLRDTYEGRAWTPPRRDVFAAPGVAVVGDAVLVAQERRVGSWTRPGEGPGRIEVAAFAADPFRTDVAQVVTASRPEAPGREPRVAALDPAVPGRGAAVAWRDGLGVVLARVAQVGDSWAVREFMRVSDEPGEAVQAVDVGSSAGVCPAVVAWRRGGEVVLRAVDPGQGRAGAVATVPGARSAASARVRVARGGARTWVAFDGTAGPQVVEVLQDAACAITARAVVLPRAIVPGSRLAGFAGDRGRAVLAATTAAPEATETPVAFATLDGARGTVAAAPAAETVRQGVIDLALLDAPVAVVMGRGQGSVRLQRVGDRDDDGEAGEDLLLRDARGLDAALTASAALHRVWVADVAGPEATPLRPAHAVVLQSAVEALEDGPRVEVPTADPPALQAHRITLDAVTVSREGGSTRAFASTFGDVPGADCVPGVWAMLRRADDDAPFPLRVPGTTWPDARPLVPASEARCGDRVLASTWKGTRLVAVVRGEAFGTRLVVGDIDAGEVRAIPLEPAGAALLGASVVRVADGLLALWTLRLERGVALRYRRFRDDGEPGGAAAALGELLEAAPGAAATRLAATSTGPREAAMALATTHGPRVFQVRCGALR